jgi:hypothetical protein
MRPDAVDAASLRSCLQNGSDMTAGGTLPLVGKIRYAVYAPTSVPMPMVDAIAAGGSFFALLTAGLVTWLVWRRWQRWRRLTIFLSYRVQSDQDLVRVATLPWS